MVPPSYVCMYVWSSHKARVRINRVWLPILFMVSCTGIMNISLSPFAPKNLVSRDGFGGPVPHQPVPLHTQAKFDAYLRDPSRFPRRRPFVYLNCHYTIGSVPSLSRHAIAYPWRSLTKVRRHRASKPQGSSSNGCCLCITMDQLICASLSRTQYWYEVVMLKVSASIVASHSHTTAVMQ